MSDSNTEPIHAEAVTEWIASRTHVTPPLRFELVPGGRSNMTFVVTDTANEQLVLRRPPLGPLLPSAHDMAREHRLMAALANTPVPVPQVIGLCDDPAINGRDFYVMSFVDGIVVRDSDIAATLTPEVRQAMSHALIDTLCELHQVDIDTVGLGDLARRDGYVERQVKRWTTQWERSKTRELPVVDRVANALTAQQPPPNAPTIAHGDYRLSNNMMNPTGTVAAVLDWELCTLGEPMADLGQLLAFWHDPDDDPNDPAVTGDVETTSLAGFATKAELAQRYTAQTARDPNTVTYYEAFAHWRLACIGEGVYARYLGGQQGSQDEDIDLDQLRDSVERRGDRAAQLLGVSA